MQNGVLSQQSSQYEARPMYPRTQYNIPRAHVTVDPMSEQLSTSSSTSHDPVYISSTLPHGSGAYGTVGGDGNLTPHGHVIGAVVNPNNTHPSQNPAYGTVGESNTGTLGKRQAQNQGHPLKSFSVPAPPPQSAPGTPQQPKHIGKLQFRL